MTNHGLLKTKARGILLRTTVGSRGAETETMHGPQLWVVAFIHQGLLSLKHAGVKARTLAAMQAQIGKIGG